MRIGTILLFLCYHVENLKILVYNPKMAFSHMQFMGKVADVLHQAGHNVTVLQPIVADKAKGTGVEVAPVIIIPQDDISKNALSHLEASKSQDFWDYIWGSSLYNPISIIYNGERLINMYTPTIKNMMSQTDLLQQLKEENFDVGITEIFDFGGVMLFHELGIKTQIGTSTFGLSEAVSLASGVPLTPSYVPASQGVTGDGTDVFTRLLNLAYTYCSHRFLTDGADSIQEIMNERYKNPPRIWDLVGDMQLFLTNSDSLLDFPRPTLTKIVNIGGIGLPDAKPLDQHWSSILSKRSKNVLISFGSIAPCSTMPLKAKENFVKVFKKFPEVTFIWKYDLDSDSLFDGVDNLVLTKWMPQNDILADDRLTLFVSHAGLGSTSEIAARGKAALLIPLFADQRRNARMLERISSAIFFNKQDINNLGKLEEAFEKGIFDETLHRTAQRVKETIALRPFTPQEMLIRNVELVAKSRDVLKLNPSGRHLGYIAYYNLDIFAVLLVAPLGLLYFTVVIIKKFCSRVRKVKND